PEQGAGAFAAQGFRITPERSCRRLVDGQDANLEWIDNQLRRGGQRKIIDGPTAFPASKFRAGFLFKIHARTTKTRIRNREDSCSTNLRSRRRRTTPLKMQL